MTLTRPPSASTPTVQGNAGTAGTSLWHSDPGAAQATLTASRLALLFAALILAAWPYRNVFPGWLCALLLALPAARLALCLRAPGQRLPSWLLVFVAAALSLLLTRTFPDLVSREGGGALLVTLVAVKTLESTRVRDGRILMLFGLFVVTTGFLFAQGLGAALGGLLSAALLLGGLTLCTPTPPGARFEKRGALNVLLALPVAGLLFVVFPRVGPLWRLSGGNSAALTGLSDTVNPGSISHLAQNRAVAFTATFEGPLPAPGSLYFRGPVMTTYDGQTWTLGRYLPGTPDLTLSGPLQRYHMSLEPGTAPWVPALDAPGPPPRTTHLNAQLELLSDVVSLNRQELDLSASTRFTYGLRADQTERQRALDLPIGLNPKARAQAASWQFLEPAARVKAGLNFFARNGLTYTLSPPALQGPDQVDDLLYRTRQGFCEHFASSFAFLMRAAGVPARLVTGYQGGAASPGPTGKTTLTVRQSDAHAWTEVWLSGQGWVRADPTAMVAPGRVNAGADGQSELTATPAEQLDFAARWNQTLTDLQTTWDTTVLGFNASSQQALFNRLHLDTPEALRWLSAVVALSVLGIAALTLRRPAPLDRDPLRRAYSTLPRRLNLPMTPGETPAEYARRAGRQYPALRSHIEALTGQYLALRYDPPGSTDAKQGSRAITAAVRRLRA